MSLPELGPITQYIRVPKTFRSSETGKPFDHCLVCNKFLLKDGTPYMIEKAIRQYAGHNVKDVIFEYALCMSCMETLNASISEESKQRINAYFARHSRLVERREKLLQRKTLRIQPWINRCVIKNTPITKSPEYQLVGQCDGKHLLFTYAPFALSLEAMDEISSLMSEKTLGEIDDFMGKYFSGPPEIAEILRKRVILV